VLRNAEALWGLPVLWLLYSRGGCLNRGMLAYLLGVDVGTVRRMLWGLRKRGYVSAEGERACLLPQGRPLVEDVEAVGWKRNKFVAVAGGLAIYVVLRASGARARPIPLQLACGICVKLSEEGEDIRRVAAEMGVAAKTVSYVAKALNVLGCPGPGCLLDCCVVSASAQGSARKG